MIDLVEKQFYSCFEDIKSVPGVECIDNEEIFWFKTGIPHGWFNCALRSRFSADPQTKVKSIIHRFRSSGLPMLWFVDKYSQPDNLDELLLAEGLMMHEQLMGMTLKLDPAFYATAYPGGLKISEVETPESMIEWLRIYSIWQDIPETELPSLFALYDHPDAYRKTPWLYLLGTLDGKPVATGAVFFSDGAAGIYYIGVLPEVRGKGFGGQITAACLESAASLGFGTVILQSTPMALATYRRFGFLETGPIFEFSLRAKR